MKTLKLLLLSLLISSAYGLTDNAALNALAGTTGYTNNGALNFLAAGSSGAVTTIASATTTNLATLATVNASITGTTTITGFGTAAAGVYRSGTFTGILTLTHNGTSLILPNGGSNITTAAGDSFGAISLGSGNWKVIWYQLASGSGGGSLPSQAGNGGKYLTTDGSVTSWGSPAGSGDALIANPLTQFTGILPTNTEFNYVDGVTSAIQTQLNAKQATITFGTGVQTALGVNVGSAGAPVLFNGALGTPTLTSSATPTTTVGQIAFDTNAWATSFGAVQVHNGTANTFLIGTTATDTPTNGQVPTWNTGGGITWETPAGGSITGTDTHVMFFDGENTPAGDAGMTYNKTTDVLSVTGGLTLGTGSSVSGAAWSGEGTAPSLVANAWTWYSPTDAPAGGASYVYPAASGTGLMLATNTAGVHAVTHVSSVSALTSAVDWPVEFCIAASDETTAITTGTAKATFRAPYAFTVTAVRLSLSTVSSSGLPTIDINESGTTILSTKLTCDASEKTSTTAATAAVISDSAIADDAEITIDFDVAGTGSTGVKVWIIGYR